MKILTQIPSILLAFLFLFGGLNFFFNFVPNPPMTGNPAKFMELFGGTGYMTVIKVLEVIGGVLILFPMRRALALVILTPIVVNILLFEIYISNAPSVGIVLAILAIITIYQERDKFKGIV
ncbi:MAG: hypothetical protein ACKOWQ_08830 [Aquirufa sp.]